MLISVLVNKGANEMETMDKKQAIKAMFDETTLHADIVREFGAHGAHVEVFDALIKARNLYEATLKDYATPANWEERHVHADISASDVWMFRDDLDGFEHAANTLLLAQPALAAEVQP